MAKTPRGLRLPPDLDKEITTQAEKEGRSFTAVLEERLRAGKITERLDEILKRIQRLERLVGK